MTRSPGREVLLVNAGSHPDDVDVAVLQLQAIGHGWRAAFVEVIEPDWGVGVYIRPVVCLALVEFRRVRDDAVWQSVQPLVPHNNQLLTAVQVGAHRYLGLLRPNQEDRDAWLLTPEGGNDFGDWDFLSITGYGQNVFHRDDMQT